MRTKVACLVAGLTVILAACSTTDDDTAASTPGATSTTNAAVTTTTSAPVTTTEATPASTTEATTTTVAATTTAAPTTTSPPTVYVPELPVTLFPPPPLAGSAGASGSGCSPGGGPLPNGVWFGLAEGTDSDHIEFDLACFYFGDIAYTEGAADGEEVNNDFYIRNVNPTLRDVPLIGPVVWTLGPFAGSGELFEVEYADWPLPGPNYTECPGDWCTVWLYVNEGFVTDIIEQFLP